jgi:hypothetical protein
MYIHFSANYRNDTDINSSTLIRDAVPSGTTHPVTQEHMPEYFNSQQHLCEPEILQDICMLLPHDSSFNLIYAQSKQH